MLSGVVIGLCHPAGCRLPALDQGCGAVKTQASCHSCRPTACMKAARAMTCELAAGNCGGGGKPGCGNYTAIVDKDGQNALRGVFAYEGNAPGKCKPAAVQSSCICTYSCQQLAADRPCTVSAQPFCSQTSLTALMNVVGKSGTCELHEGQTMTQTGADVHVCCLI